MDSTGDRASLTSNFSTVCLMQALQDKDIIEVRILYLKGNFNTTIKANNI